MSTLIAIVNRLFKRKNYYNFYEKYKWKMLTYALSMRQS